MTITQKNPKNRKLSSSIVFLNNFGRNCVGVNLELLSHSTAPDNTNIERALNNVFRNNICSGAAIFSKVTIIANTI